MRWYDSAIVLHKGTRGYDRSSQSWQTQSHVSFRWVDVGGEGVGTSLLYLAKMPRRLSSHRPHGSKDWIWFLCADVALNLCAL
jgi:hypothetical protein